MAVKVILILCAQALLIQSVFSQCTSRAAIDASGIGSPYLANPGIVGPLARPGLPCNGLAGPLAYNGLAPGLAYDGVGYTGRALPLEFTATKGGSLPVTSSSAIAPTGISVVSENKFEGTLSMAGELPFVGTSGVEGTLPTAGAGATNHACGDGITAMISEATIAPTAATFPAAPISSIAAITPTAATFGPAAISPAAFGPTAGAFGPAPFAGRFGLGSCASSFIN